MKRANLIAITAAVMMMAQPVWADDVVTNDETWVYVHRDGELIHQARTCGETVYTDADLNLRTAPGYDGEIVDVIPAGSELLRVGRHDEWSVIQVDGVNYFANSFHLTPQKPQEATSYHLGKEVAKEVSNEPVRAENEATGVYLGDWTITFYCNCSECCGQWAGGNTASGTVPTEGRTVACGSLDFGTVVYIDGLGEYIVEDRGVNGDWIDVYLDSHERCNQMGMLSRGVYLK